MCWRAVFLFFFKYISCCSKLTFINHPIFKSDFLSTFRALVFFLDSGGAASHSKNLHIATDKRHI